MSNMREVSRNERSSPSPLSHERARRNGEVASCTHASRVGWVARYRL